MNEYLISRMGVGHSGSINAYLFIPMFFWLIYQFVQRQDMHWKENVRNVILFSLFIFFAKLNANGQNVYQFLLVGIFSFFDKKKNIQLRIKGLYSYFCLLIKVLLTYFIASIRIT